ncbi:MAG: hypothetical protein HOV96_09485 [Nonomuraea sp.]|nr:hypothetical protein [Nonomuraea sp.]
MRHKKAVVVAASTLFSAVAFIAPTSAVAASPEFDFAKSAPEGPEPGSPCTSNPVVKACFQSDGDKIYIKDMKADGQAAYTDWAILGGRYGQCATKLRAGNWGVCDKDFPERQTIQLTIWYSSHSESTIATT